MHRQRVRGIGESVVKPSDENARVGELILDEIGTDALPITGTLISSSVRLNGKPGDVVYYQYNGTIDATKIGRGRILLPDEIFYSIGGKMINDWVFFKLVSENKLHRIGEIVGSSRRFFKPSTVILTPKSLCHRVIPRMFADVPLFAVKWYHIVMYK